MYLTPVSEICLQLVETGEICAYYSHLPPEVEVDGVESDEMTDTISDVFDACIRDVIAASRDK